MLFAVPGPVAGDTLIDAFIQAYNGNPVLLARRAELRALDEGVPQALSNWRPTITATGSVNYINSESQTSGFGGLSFTTSGDTTAKSVRVQIEQPIFRGFRTLAEMNQAEHLVRAGRADLIATEQQVFLDTVTAYMDVLRDQAVVELNVNNEQVLRRQLEAATDRFDVGEVTRTDVAQAESRLARATADRVQAEGDLETSRATYVNVVGSPPGALEPPSAFAGLPQSLEEAIEQARNGNPQVVAALYRERAAGDSIELVTGELLPSVELTASYDHAFDPSVTTVRSEQYSIGAQVTIPIYQAGQVFSRVREAKEIASQRRMEVVGAQRDAVEEATQAWETLVATRAQVVAFQEEARSTEIALEGVNQESLAGLRTVLDVLDAEQEHLDARVNLVRAQRDEVVASYALLAAIGQLTAAELALPVQLYDLEAHYREVRMKFIGLGDDPTPNAGN